MHNQCQTSRINFAQASAPLRRPSTFFHISRTDLQDAERFFCLTANKKELGFAIRTYVHRRCYASMSIRGHATIMYEGRNCFIRFRKSGSLFIERASGVHAI
jgi:hypothetical protein